jgi:hypothetical protein
MKNFSVQRVKCNIPCEMAGFSNCRKTNSVIQLNPPIFSVFIPKLWEGIILKKERMVEGRTEN